MPGHAAALLRLLRRRAGHIVGQQDGGGLDILHLQHFAGHVEIHHVAAIIAVEAQDTGAAVGLAHCLGHLLGGGRGEDVADGGRIQQPLAHIAGEDGQMPRTTAGDDPDLAGYRPAGPGDDARRGLRIVFRMGQAQAVQHFVDIVDRVVQNLLHVRFPPWRDRASRRRRLPTAREDERVRWSQIRLRSVSTP